MKKYYSFFVSLLVDNKLISEGEKELYKYSIIIFCRDLFNIITTVLLGLMLQMTTEIIVFYMSFLILRKMSGGIHFNKYVVCYIISTIVILISFLIIKFFKYNPINYRYQISIIISAFTIMCLSPLENKNKPLSSKEKLIYKHISIFISITLSLISLYTINCTKLSRFGVSIGMAIILDSMLLISGYISRIIKSIIRQ